MLLPSVPAFELILRSLVIYAALLFALRVFGKREVGQFTLYDLVFVLLVANAVQPAMTGPDNSLGGGVIIIATLIGANFAVGRLARLPWLRRAFAAQATIIIRDGSYLKEALRREGLDQDECETAIREHGLAQVSDVHLGVLEPDGTISIVAKDATSATGHHRVRRRFRAR